MTLMSAVTGGKVHTRHFEIDTYPAGEEHIVVAGRLSDDRLVATYHADGQTSPPRTYHHMVVRLLVKGPSMRIEDLEVGMPTAPREACRETCAMFAPLVGVHIASGFTSRVKKLFGGPRGCAHVLSLLLAMAPAAIQGFWSLYAQDPARAAAHAPAMESYLVDTCYVWRAGSRFAAEQLAALKRR